MKSRFQFRLRTLMIVVTLLAVACAYVGSQLRLKSERYRAWGDYHIYNSIPTANKPGSPSESREAPWPLNWLGAPGARMIFMPENVSKSEVERVKRLFPEAEVRIE
jgi:hypothetical protein